MIFFFYFRPLSFSTLNIHRPWSLVTTRWKEIICTAVKKKETKSGKKWKFLSMCVKFCVCEYNPHRLWPIERQRLVFFLRLSSENVIFIPRDNSLKKIQSINYLFFEMLFRLSKSTAKYISTFFNCLSPLKILTHVCTKFTKL